jgi:D-glycero-D-manno-heptose 1,7-bisphosphate phosphatase
VKPPLLSAVFLDRDGVLNSAIVKKGKPHPPSSVEDLEIQEDVLPCLVSLRKAGFVLIGITNQPDVARGTQTREAVELINKTLLDKLPLADIKVCYHDEADHCDCRKPLPGLILQASDEYGIDLASSYMVGDRWKDVEAGQRAGCRSIWIDCGYDEIGPDLALTERVLSLREAAALILERAQG